MVFQKIIIGKVNIHMKMHNYFKLIVFCCLGINTFIYSGDLINKAATIATIEKYFNVLQQQVSINKDTANSTCNNLIQELNKLPTTSGAMQSCYVGAGAIGSAVVDGRYQTHWIHISEGAARWFCVVGFVLGSAWLYSHYWQR